jgi:hypothetical protein
MPERPPIDVNDFTRNEPLPEAHEIEIAPPRISPSLPRIARAPRDDGEREVLGLVALYCRSGFS